MNRTRTLTFASTLALIVAGSAQAAGPREGHLPHGASGHSVPQHAPYRHSRGYPYRRHDDDGDDFVKVAAGALVLGTIIYAISQSSQKTGQAGPATTAAIPASAPPPATGAPEDFWYRIDSEGRCVLVYLNAEGREVWTDVDSTHCE